MINVFSDLEYSKNRIYNMIINRDISLDDIANLSSLQFVDIEKLDCKNSFKNKILTSIYCNPYLLCNDKLLELDNFDFESFQELLIKRYNDELTEYEELVKNGLMSYLEYNNNVILLHQLYFSSSKIGMRIERINDGIIEKKKKRG